LKLDAKIQLQSEEKAMQNQNRLLEIIYQADALRRQARFEVTMAIFNLADETAFQSRAALLGKATHNKTKRLQHLAKSRV
jgi:hypothetical protein